MAGAVAEGIIGGTGEVVAGAAASRGFALLGLGLVLFDIAFELFELFDWGQGVARVAVLGGFGALMLAVGLLPRPRIGAPGPRLRRAIGIGFGVLLAANIGFAGETLVHTASTGEIRLDQGQTTYNAVRLLRDGHDPYGPQALLDGDAYFKRLPDRQGLGIGPIPPEPALEGDLERYWASFDPSLREALLPEPVARSEAANREALLLGYKYGPVLLWLALPVVAVLGAVAIPLGNIAAYGLVLLSAWGIARAAGAGRSLALLAVGAVLLNPQMVKNFLFYTATDIWPLMFGLLAAWSLLRGHRLLPAVLVALAIGCKIVPGVLFLPLLLMRPSRQAAAAFLLSLILPMLPWLVHDTRGFLDNAVLWGMWVEPDSTSWIAAVPPAVVLPVKAAVACLAALAGGVAAWRLRAGQSWFWAMGLFAVLVIPLGSTFHNNYLSWFSVWAPLAIVALALPEGSEARRAGDGG